MRPPGRRPIRTASRNGGRGGRGRLRPPSRRYGGIRSGSRPIIAAARRSASPATTASTPTAMPPAPACAPAARPARSAAARRHPASAAASASRSRGALGACRPRAPGAAPGRRAAACRRRAQRMRGPVRSAPPAPARPRQSYSTESGARRDGQAGHVQAVRPRLRGARQRQPPRLLQALHGQGRPEIARMPRVDCRECGKTFPTRTRSVRYCSDECRTSSPCAAATASTSAGTRRTPKSAPWSGAHEGVGRRPQGQGAGEAAAARRPRRQDPEAQRGAGRAVRLRGCAAAALRRTAAPAQSTASGAGPGSTGRSAG